MPKLNSKKVVLATLAIAAGIGLDQVTKRWALEALPHNPMEVIPGALTFQYVENHAAAFGMFSFIPDAYRLTFLLVLTISLAALLVVALIWAPNFGTRLGFGCVLSGAVGNIIDRLDHGYVIDFISWHGGFRWPNFNVADILVCVGAGIFLLFGGLKKAPDRT